MTEYAWIQDAPYLDKTYYFRSDSAVAHSCTDEAAESSNRNTTTIMFYETDETDEEDQS